MADLLASLRAHAPFDEMEPAALEFLAGQLGLGYHPRGAVVVGPDSGVAERATTPWAMRSPPRSSCSSRSPRRNARARERSKHFGAFNETAAGSGAGGA